MYIVTNRQINRNSATVDNVFGKRPNQEGPNNLRVAEITVADDGEMHAEVLKDRLTRAQVMALKKKFNLPLNANKPHYVDLLVACKLMERVQKENKNILIFIHGFNNDVNAVVRRAKALEKQFNVIVLPFTWPADGGGLNSVINYKNDKNDARVSTVALDRFIRFVDKNIQFIRTAQRHDIITKVKQRYPEKNSEKRDALYSQLMEKRCPFRISLMLHSMGNYLFKRMMKSTTSHDLGLVFDNVVMVAPDTNNENHAEWVDKIRFRNRLYITINESDYALQASRAKGGSGQQARLGHVTHQLQAQRAMYINFTDAEHVGFSHTYFTDDALKNERVKHFFEIAFNGKTVEKGLQYRIDLNCYECKTR